MGGIGGGMDEGAGRNGVLLAGRLLLAACFAPAAYAHMANISGFALSLRGQGLPYADAVAAFVVLAEIFGPLAVIFGFAPRVGATVLMGATALNGLALHRFWEFSGAARQAEQGILLAHAALVAALLFFIAAGPGGLSWQAWWRGEKPRPKPAARKKPSRPRSPKPRPSPARTETAEEDLADAA